MKIKFCKMKLLPVFLTLCIVLLLVPCTVFAQDINLPSGVKYTSNYHHQYYTKIDVNANVSIKDLDGTVVETKQVTKTSGNFLKGGLSDEAVKSTLSNIWSDIETPYKSQGTVKHENNDGKMSFDHFDSGHFYTFTPKIGDVITFETEEEAQQYFDEHQDATGTFNKLLDVYEYQIYKNTYDLIVEKNTSPAITQVNINSLYNYEVGSTPHATAKLSQDENEYEIAYECWEEMENGEPIAFWYSDESKYIPSMKRITKFEDGKTYMYSIELREKDGYKFSNQCDVYINNKKQSTVIKTINGLFMPSIETIHPVMVKEIGTIEINNATLKFKDGDKPVFTGTTPENAKYMLVFEEWRTDGEWTRSDKWFNDDEHHGNDKTITTFDKNKTYHYNLFVQPTHNAGSEGWVFGPHTKLIINGKEVTYTYKTDAEYENGLRYDFFVFTPINMIPDSTHTHSFKWFIDKEATTTEKGSKHEECTICGYKKAFIDIPMKDLETKANGSAITEDKKIDIVVKDTPKTGDNTNVSLGLSVFVLSLFGLVALCKKKYTE